MAWNVLLFVVGLVAGGVPAVYGLGKKIPVATVVAVAFDAAVKGVQALGGGTQQTVRSTFDLFVTYNLQGYVLYLATGAVSGFVAMSFGLAAVVFAVNHHRYSQAGHAEPAAEARERAVVCFTKGLLAYRDEYAKEKPPETDKDRLLVFAGVLIEDLEQQLAAGIRDIQHARALCKQMGGSLLALMFEKERKDFRIAVFEMEGPDLFPHVRVGHSDSPHSGCSLPLLGSTLGHVIQTGRPILWSQGDPNTPYFKRGSTTYKSFYAHPIPAEDLPKWAGVTLDHVRKRKKAFTKHRLDAVRLFARYVQVVYTESKKGGAS